MAYPEVLNPIIWLSGQLSNITFNGDNVNVIEDMTTNSIDFYQNTVADQPEYLYRNQSLIFDGVTDFFHGSTHPSLDYNDFTYAFAGVFNADSRILSMGASTNNSNVIYIYTNATGQIVAWIDDDNSDQSLVTGVTNISDGNFHTFYVIRQNDQLYIYIDGNLDKQETVTTDQVLGSLIKPDLGRFYTSRADMELYDFSTYNYALNSTQRSGLNSYLEGLENNYPLKDQELWIYPALGKEDVTGSLVDKAYDLTDNNFDFYQTTADYKPTLVNDEYLHFDGINDYFLTNSPTPNLTGDFSIVLGVDLKSSGYFFSYGSSVNNSNSIRIGVEEDGTLAVSLNNDLDNESSVISLSDVTDGYHTIIFTREGSVGKIYIDGVLDNSGTVTTDNIDNDIAMHMGLLAPESPKAEVDFYDLEIYNRLLSTQEINSIVSFHEQGQGGGIPFLCWVAIGRFQNGRTFQQTGPGKFPKDFKWPQKLQNKCVIEDGKKII